MSIQRTPYTPPPASATREVFIQAYADQLRASFDWAADTAHLERFLSSVRVTLASRAATWNHNSIAVQRAWRAIGGHGRVSLAKLRALPGAGPAGGPADGPPAAESRAGG